MLLNFTKAGYTIFHVPDNIARGGFSLPSEPLPTMHEVTSHNLAYDIWDAEMFK
jgi:hypothetical protein